MSNTLAKAIEKSKPEQIDLCWAVLKYKEIGVLRKIKALCSAFGLNLEQVTSELPKDENERIIDWETRHMIHDSLIKMSTSNKQ
jgi:hypothetical protein